jgi:hypothetical protein
VKASSGGWIDLRQRYFLGSAAVDAVSAYVKVEGGRPKFTGSQFNTWAGGGLLEPNRITVDDVLAVQFLSMRPYSQTLWDLAEGKRQAIEHALARVPTDATLWSDGDGVDAALGAADDAYAAIETVRGAGWVTAAKLLARKRPDLVPVKDRVIRKAVGSGAFWRPLRQWLRTDDNLDRLVEVREAAGATPEQVPVLRVFDIVIWPAERPRRTQGRRSRVDDAPQD